MDMINNIFQWILKTSISSSIFILIIILFRKIFKDKIKPNFIYLLWILVIIKLTIPINIPSNYSFYNIVPDKYIEYNITENIINNPISNKNNNIVSTENINKINNESKTSNNISSQKNNINFNNIINLFPIIWLVGIISFSIIFIISSIKFKNSQKNITLISNENILDLFTNLKNKLNIEKDIKLYTGYSFSTTFISGIFYPKIYIPAYYLDKLSIDNLEYIFLHEFSHFKRKDIIVNTIQIIIQVLYWFNPLVYIAMALMRDDRELACDDYVMEILENENSISYGMTIIEMAKISIKNNSPKYLVSFSNKEPLIKRRIKMVDRFKKINNKTKIIIFLLIVLVGVLFLTNYNNDIFSGKRVYYDESNMYFYDLAEAMDFIDYKFKLPTYLNNDYKFDLLSKNNNIYKITYTQREYVENSSFVNLNISKENFLNIIENELDKQNYNISQKTIDGTDFTIINLSNIHTDKTANVYMWKDNEIYYTLEEGISVLSSSYKGQSSSSSALYFEYLLNHLVEDGYISKDKLDKNLNITNFTDNDLIEILNSMEDINNINLSQYKNENSNRKKVLNSDDIGLVEEKFGYKVLFPNKLDNDYKILNAEIDGLERNRDISLYTQYINSESKNIIYFTQSNSKGNNKLFEESELDYKKIKIADIDVKYIDNGNFLDSSQNISYIWKINDDRVYQVDFIFRNDDNTDPKKIVTTLVKETKKIK